MRLQKIHEPLVVARLDSEQLHGGAIAAAGCGEPMADQLAHQSVEAAKASFDAFRKDPDWIAAKDASEKAAGGSLTVETDGVKSVFLKATDYSPTR